LVHVAGAVVKSGVYQLPKGARVADAIAAAGGAAGDGVPDALNLAEGLADGQKVLVPTKKELEAAPPVAFTASGPSAGGSGSGGTSAKPAAPGKVNVNTGTVSQFDALPGVTPTAAKNIVDYRTKYGPFKKLDDLDKVSGIGPATLDKMRPYLTF
jgi:competence protein ComEA